MKVEVVPTAGLGNRSYVVHHEGVALAIDPQRDLDRLLARVPAGADVTHVLETHLHNDYVTGGLELARRAGADLVMAAAEDVAYDNLAVRDGDVIETGDLRVTVLSSPGHTPHHLSYVVSCGQQRAVFTGGSLLYGTVGRTDLLGPELAEGLTRLQHRSVRRLLSQLETDVVVYPTHGFGSFCSAAGGGGDGSESTIGRERSENLACAIEGEDRFVRTLLGGLGAYPRYYAHMAPINRAGPPPVDLSAPADVSPEELADRHARGDWLIDVRPRRAFASSHARGTVNVELDDQLATYVGWLLPWGTPITVLATGEEEAARAQRMLSRIGLDRPLRALGGPAPYVEALGGGSYRVSDFPGLAAAEANGEELAVLDVRRAEEWREGHIAGALHVPLHDLAGRAGEVPAGQVWVHCASGYRAAIAASLLDAAGASPVLIDDHYGNAQGSGLEVTAS